MGNIRNEWGGGQGLAGRDRTEANMNQSSKRIRIDLEPDEAISVEIPLEESKASPLYSKLYHWLRDSGKLAAMSGSACKVYNALLTRADFNNLDCYPSLKRISFDSGVGLTQVKVAIMELVKLGVITRLSGKQPGGNVSNRYMIIPPPHGRKPTEGRSKSGRGMVGNRS